MVIEEACSAAQLNRLIPQRASVRVIVDNDFAGDPDGLVALAHQLLTPRAQVRLVTASALDATLSAEHPIRGRTAAAGRDVAEELIKRAGITKPPTVIAGPENFYLGPSEAARAIVAEAMRDDPLPLFLTCGGPLTNVAAALRLEPAIASRMTVVWIGGGDYPTGQWEYNLATDTPAAREVFENRHVALWQVPQNAYRQMQFSIAEMTADLRPISPFTRWLYDRFTSPPSFVTLGGTWPLGDSPLVLLTSISAESSRYVEHTAQLITPNLTYGAAIAGRMVRVYQTLDARLTFADFLALLRLQALHNHSHVRLFKE